MLYDRLGAYLGQVAQNSFWAGDRPSFHEGVFLYWSSAQASLSSSRHLPVHDALISVFMGFTVASALPLFWGYLGDNMIHWNPHCLVNSLNSLDMNCGPWSDQNILLWQKDPLRALVRWGVEVLWPIGIMSGQSAKLSMV